MMSVNVQTAFDILMAIFVVAAPIGLLWAVLSRAFRGFIDMVTGRDSIRL